MFMFMLVTWTAVFKSDPFYNPSVHNYEEKANKTAMQMTN